MLKKKSVQEMQDEAFMTLGLCIPPQLKHHAGWAQFHKLPQVQAQQIPMLVAQTWWWTIRVELMMSSLLLLSLLLLQLLWMVLLG
jgi:hypothetical protein